MQDGHVPILKRLPARLKKISEVPKYHYCPSQQRNCNVAMVRLGNLDA